MSELTLYRVDLKGGEVAHVVDTRSYTELCAELLVTRRELQKQNKDHPNPFEDLQAASREAGWLFFETGMFNVKQIEGFSAEIAPPEELVEYLERRQELDEEEEEAPVGVLKLVE